MVKVSTKKITKTKVIDKTEFANNSENIFKVPMKQWKQWTSAERMVFNWWYGHMTRDKNLYLHPKAEKIMTDELWKTTAWNVAWMVATEIQVFKKTITGL